MFHILNRKASHNKHGDLFNRNNTIPRDRHTSFGTVLPVNGTGGGGRKPDILTASPLKKKKYPYI
ncbi:hypothetical protein MQE36_04500 [Zhouia spongiae]|uniref:Uncharacterized protein n=1 Tax=Zhouia spongiae TaxID=2202721 RepID=A0ABY3YPH6_9FLAO|nr:hypothetical protein [Zhouia spongiae]UNY99608.1 hypothetical protein MQE36_04500 [Zhouia spongiae]